LSEEMSIRMILLLIFLEIVGSIFLVGRLEKRTYHVLSFAGSMAVCEFTFSVFYGNRTMNIETVYLKWIAVHFIINIFFFVFIIGVIVLFIYFRAENRESLTVKEYLLLSIIPTASLLMIGVIKDMFFFPKIVICICLIFVNLSYIMIYDQIEKKNYDIHRYSVIEEQNHYYRERIKNQQEILQMRHDIKNILLTIDFYVSKGDMEKAKEQVGALIKTKVMDHDEYTGCVAVDSILNVKIQKIKEIGIHYNMKLQIPKDLIIQENKTLDISAILGNLLDNAIEGVLRIPRERERKIDIVIQYNDSKLIFNIQNTSNPIGIDFSNKLIKSEKGKDRYGIGISSVKERICRLEGYYDFQYKDGYYMVFIVIPMEKKLS